MLLHACALDTAWADGIAVGDLIQGLKQREAAVSNFSVLSRYEMVQRSPFEPTSHPLTRGMVPLKHVIQHTVESSGRFRWEFIGQQLASNKDGPNIREFRSRGVFDGESTRIIEGTDDADESAAVWPRARLELPLDPRDFDMYFSGKPVSAYLQAAGASVEVAPLAGNSDVLVVDTADPAENIEDFGRLTRRFWVDTARNFVVLKRHTLLLPPGERTPFAYIRVDGDDWLEVEPGIWLPQRLQVEEYTHPKGTFKLLRRIDVRNENWLVNQTLSPETFRVEFPAKLIINDRALGKTYLSRVITDDTVATQVAEAKAMRARLAEMPSREEIARRLAPSSSGTWRLTLLVVLGVAGLVGAGGLIWWRKR